MSNVNYLRRIVLSLVCAMQPDCIRLADHMSIGQNSKAFVRADDEPRAASAIDGGSPVRRIIVVFQIAYVNAHNTAARNFNIVTALRKSRRGRAQCRNRQSKNAAILKEPASPGN